MKLDPTVMRTMNRQDYRVLTAVETGMQNRALVPSPVITSIANLRHGGSQKILSSLLRDNLLSHDQSCGYDGYRVTNSGYDILALHNLKCRGYVSALGDQIGVGKESDVYLAVNPQGRQVVLKFHRLGRTSFRDVKKKRDYFAMNSLTKGTRGRDRGVTSKDRPNSWLFLSKMSAHKEFLFMKALHAAGYNTPEPLMHNRHVVVMGLVRGVPLYQIRPPKPLAEKLETKSAITIDQAKDVMREAVEIGAQLARNGLVHCDLNEFNLLVDLSGGVQSRGHLEQSPSSSSYSIKSSSRWGDGMSSIGGGNSTFRSTTVKDDVGDHYVRHSGSSASVVSRGRGALTLPHGVPLGASQRTTMDGTGEVVTEEPETMKPDAYLPNGIDPKPVVTLIDFPQMISVRHPNAQELWMRDMECLKRFFTKKLKVDVSDEEWNDMVPDWEDLILQLEEEDADLGEVGEEEDVCDGDGDGDATVDGGRSVRSVSSVTSTGSLIPKRQLRLDQELHATGFSKEDAERHMELYYYNNDTGMPIQEEEDEEEEDDENDEDEEENKEKQKDTNESDHVTPLDQHNNEPNLDNNTNNDNNDNENQYDGVITDSDSEDDNKNNHKDNNDEASVAISITSAFSTMTTEQRRSRAEQIARERVRHHLDTMKKSKTRKGAFRPKNSNKTFVKGKRVFQDFSA